MEKEKEKENKRIFINRKRKLILLFIAMLFTMVLFTTSTYAWFTANKTVKVNTLTVNVAAQNGIQISTDGSNWKSIIQTSDIENAHSTYGSSINQLPQTMEPVSTIGNVDSDGLMEMFYGVVTTNAGGDYILTATQSVEVEEHGEDATGKFIAFDLFFKVDAATDVYITSQSGVKTTDATDTGIKNASRIAFVDKGHVSAGASLTDIRGINNGTDSEVFIWEPNYDVHTAAAVSHAYDVYKVETAQTGGNILAYSGVKADIASTVGVLVNQNSATAYTTGYGDYFDTVSVDKSTPAGTFSNFKLTTLSAGITKVRIYMWIEGQDVDCENNASGGTITYDLQFTTEA